MKLLSAIALGSLTVSLNAFAYQTYEATYVGYKKAPIADAILKSSVSMSQVAENQYYYSQTTIAQHPIPGTIIGSAENGLFEIDGDQVTILSSSDQDDKKKQKFVFDYENNTASIFRYEIDSKEKKNYPKTSSGEPDYSKMPFDIETPEGDHDKDCSVQLEINKPIFDEAAWRFQQQLQVQSGDPKALTSFNIAAMGGKKFCEDQEKNKKRKEKRGEVFSLDDKQVQPLTMTVEEVSTEQLNLGDIILNGEPMQNYTVEAVKVVNSKSSTKKFIIWYAKNHGYLPIKLEQQKKKGSKFKLDFVMQAQELNFNE